MSPKDELLTTLADVRAELEAIVLAEDADLQANAGDDWRVIDLFAHISLWERVATQKLTGEPVSYAEKATPEAWHVVHERPALLSRR